MPLSVGTSRQTARGQKTERRKALVTPPIFTLSPGMQRGGQKTERRKALVTEDVLFGGIGVSSDVVRRQNAERHW